MLSQAPANRRRRFTVCIICLEFQKSRDIADARLMLKNARREPKSVDQDTWIKWSGIWMRPKKPPPFREPKPQLDLS